MTWREMKLRLRRRVRMIKKTAFISVLLLFCVLLAGCGSKADGETAETYADGVHYEYSKGGNSRRITSRGVWKDGELTENCVYDYWETGKLKSITNYSGDTKTEEWYYSYAENGTLSRMIRIFTEDGQECRDDYTYNENGRIDSVKYYSKDTEIGGIRYTYNENAVETKEEQYDRNGDVIAYTEYEFDGENVIGAKSYQYGSLSSYWEYSYNDGGKLSEVRFYNYKGELNAKEEHIYDASGRQTKVNSYNSDGKLYGYTESLYDDNGFNYRDIYYENGKPKYCWDYTEDGAAVYSEY